MTDLSVWPLPACLQQQPSVFSVEPGRVRARLHRTARRGIEYAGSDAGGGLGLLAGPRR
ncbi:hypothetical protein [Streptomyces xanthophaeus]|uniref:hypothetical protein n=1 Tax=Streptomyces xanthophaeus TaxID=67385 RepID=UPI0018FF2BA0|nr:hypothetical protein [Streptomyces xanthophaeus]